MRILFVDANYPAFLDKVYRDVPDLANASYAEQTARIRSGLFGEAQFQAAALNALGHEAEVVVTNAHHAQRAWALENGRADLARRPLRIRRRCRIVPWVSRTDSTVDWAIVVSQAKAFRPDILYVEIMDTMPAAVAQQLRKYARLSVAQVATALPDGAYRAYDLVLSSIPAMVQAFRGAGVAAEWVPLAFEPSVLDEVGTVDRDVPVSFVGSFTDAYADRTDVVEAVARVADLHTWTDDRAYLSSDSLIKKTIRGSAFGREMYQVLARSRVTLNSHGLVSGRDANNLRLFEATGMGTLLITDHRDNLGDLFHVGTELVTYRSPTEAGEVVEHYLANPDEAARIASAGQARTLRDHTWRDRMSRLLELVLPRL
jgi:hypothetical protein